MDFETTQDYVRSCGREDTRTFSECWEISRRVEVQRQGSVEATGARWHEFGGAENFT